jgi:MFS family permease
MAAVAFVLGCILGGVMGDIGSRKSWPSVEFCQNSVRILIAQFGYGLGVPAITILILVLGDIASFSIFLPFTFFAAFVLSWPGQACDNPILTEVIPPIARTTGIGLSYMISGVFSSIGSLLVGVIADSMGYVEIDSDVEIQSLPSDIREQNKNALSNSLLVICCAFWSTCFLIYFPLYSLYPSQRNLVHSQLRAQKELEKKERDTLDDLGE